ncbi:MAG TPA: prepilin-type N-terminal cleavage/methylation domain-containing protein [Candidatus Saccharimonadales bacterium]|nr:prepilin-type N-terminal cleavage/methylation domain-containing protein [Candidatus Saccharimonadales bacterium]
MYRLRGFTIVEVVVVVSVLAILISISFFAYTKVQQDARDNTRRGNVTIIAEALEKYHRSNGEYPSVRNLVNNYAGNTGTVVAALLKIDANALKMPRMPAGATNALYSAGSPVNDYIIYAGSSVTNNAACQSSTTGGCEKFTLTYAQETGPNVTISSRR